MDAAADGRETRGADLLLLHCAALTGADDKHPSAHERLEALVGGELAEFLLEGLAVPDAGRARVAL